MTRSLAELRHTCQKAGEGAGLPAGLDVAAAEAVAWLAARGLDPLPAFLGALTQVSRGALRCDLNPGDGGTLDAGGAAGAIVAAALVDLLAARGRLGVAGLSAPLFLLPPAVRYGAAGRWFRFELRGPDGRRYRMTTGAEEDAAIFGPSVPSDDTPFTVDAVCGPAPDGALDPLPLVADGEALRRRADASLAAGLPVAPEDWDRLQAHAVKVLVLATTQSRASGAGWSGSRGG